MCLFGIGCLSALRANNFLSVFCISSVDFYWLIGKLWYISLSQILKVVFNPKMDQVLWRVLWMKCVKISFYAPVIEKAIPYSVIHIRPVCLSIQMSCPSLEILSWNLTHMHYHLDGMSCTAFAYLRPRSVFKVEGPIKPISHRPSPQFPHHLRYLFFNCPRNHQTIGGCQTWGPGFSLRIYM